MYEYLRDNKCTDGALERAVEEIANNYTYDAKLTGVGLAFALASCAASILLFICTSKLIKECLGGCCNCFSGLKNHSP